MTRKGMVGLMVVLALVSMTACKKKQATTNPDLVITPSTMEPTPTEVSSGPEPTIRGDEEPDPWAVDLQEASERAMREGLLGDVFFDYDQYELRQDARDRLAQNARFLGDHPEFIVTIEGHADDRGTNDYNLALGERRANAAKAYLETLGVSSSRVRTLTYGEERPFCGESSESCWQQNRRAHFSITGRAAVG
jgi:peptidoglycan-associated lipoprotein